MEKKKCACKNGGCGKNRTPDRITVKLGEEEITNRDLICRSCVYKKRGDTTSCMRYEKKPEAVLSGGACEYFLGEVGAKKGGCDCGDCGEHSCNDCGDCGNCGGCEK